jgi:hypothetical protein
MVLFLDEQTRASLPIRLYRVGHPRRYHQYCYVSKYDNAIPAPWRNLKVLLSLSSTRLLWTLLH